MEAEKLAMIDKLMEGWTCWETEKAFYIGKLVPSIVERGEEAFGLEADKKSLVHELKAYLTQSEWKNLPAIVEERHSKLEKSRKDSIINMKKEQQKQDRERQERRERLKKEKEETPKLIKRILESFESDFLGTDKRRAEDPDGDFLRDSDYLDLKGKFLQEWAKKELKESLDSQQAKAAALFGGDIRVIARAGSGKTRTLVTRALFLQKHCGIDPGEILLLAFNRSAARQVREKLEKHLPEGKIPHVMTFHALAYALVHPEEELLFDDSNESNLGLSKEIQRVIDEHLQSDHFRPIIRDLMLSHFEEDWEKIVKGGFQLPLEELISFREALPRETLKGDYVKSFGEKLIANILFRNDIDYRYECNFRWDEVNYKPDFMIPLSENGGIVIEYFGLKGEPDYDKMSQHKRQFWDKKKGWKLIEFSPSDITSKGPKSFENLLLDQLRTLGIKGRLLNKEELWERIRRRAIDKFTGAMKSFVSRSRKRNLTPVELQGLIAGHEPINEAERLFLEVAISVYSRYLLKLSETKQEDFDGLMWRAIDLLKKKHSCFARDKGREKGDLRTIRYILVDEFQDFSETFYSLLQGIRSLNPAAEFFFVGDDWQAINGFAGSELKYFEHFKAYFRNPVSLEISTNYRSPKQVVQIGNALMKDFGTPARANKPNAGWVKASCLDAFKPTILEKERHERDEATPAILRLLKYLLDHKKDVVLLSRVNRVPWYVNSDKDKQNVGSLEGFAEHLRSFFPEEQRKHISVSTAHKYKGLEKAAVILLDADVGRYPLVHPNWVFLRVFGDSVESIVSEERRLFYVALTRSMDSLVVLSSDCSKKSSFWEEVQSQVKLESIDWADYKPIPSLDGERLEIQVRNGYEVREELKSNGFQWDQGMKTWKRLVIAEGFDFDTLCKDEWAKDFVEISVYSEKGEELYSR